MAELRTMAQDITKNTGDIENYSKEFIELQSQLNQISKEKFNGISLFGTSNASAVAGGVLNTGTASFGSIQYNTLSQHFTTHDSGSTESEVINVINFQFMLSIHSTASGGTGVDLGNIDSSNTGSGITGGYVNGIKEVSVSQFMDIISRIADMRAENGAEQTGLCRALTYPVKPDQYRGSPWPDYGCGHRVESTRFARHNILVQASASMTAQANQLSSVALSLIG